VLPSALKPSEQWPPALQEKRQMPAVGKRTKWQPDGLFNNSRGCLANSARNVDFLKRGIVFWHKSYWRDTRKKKGPQGKKRGKYLEKTQHTLLEERRDTKLWGKRSWNG